MHADGLERKAVDARRPKQTMFNVWVVLLIVIVIVIAMVLTTTAALEDTTPTVTYPNMVPTHDAP